MRKKIISLMLAALMLFGITAMAEGETAAGTATHKAVLLVYNADNQLVLAKTLTAENGEFDFGVVPQSMGTKRKLYFIDTQQIIEVQSADGSVPEDTTVPDPIAAPTAEPEETAAPEATVAPEATTAPTATPKPSSSSDTSSPYEKEAYGISASALVTEVATSVNSNNEDVYAVSFFYHGKEMTANIDADLTIATAPSEFSFVQGQTAQSLEKGDVICITANIAGDKIKRIDLLFRPTADDIATDTTDYGTNFEKLFTTGSSVAGQWPYQKYGSRVTNDKYSYAFGIVADKSSNNITLINKSNNPDDALDIDVNPNAYVYVCEVDGKEYDCFIGGMSDVQTLPAKATNGDEVILSEDYTYNYALVRMVEGEATDIVVFNNYNE